MLFPETTPLGTPLWPITPYDWRFDFATIISRNPESGRVQSRPGRSVDLMYATLTFPIRPIADYGNLRAFCRAAMGMSARFTFRDFNGTSSSYGSPPVAPWPVNDAYGYAGAGAILCTKADGTAAVGDGAVTLFDLPFGSTTSALVYLDGQAPTGNNYTIYSASGADGRDQVQFTTAPTAGQVVTASCTLGRLMVYARLATDSFSAKTFVGGGGPMQPTLTVVQDIL